ncbi:MAG TPA: hypothetical protein VLF71_00945 [Candidatus Saccharimonadales bacterium]|nr:hypothetical protein [Candidatus Saccharimonadales bacterium]
MTQREQIDRSQGSGSKPPDEFKGGYSTPVVPTGGGAGGDDTSSPSPYQSSSQILNQAERGEAPGDSSGEGGGLVSSAESGGKPLGDDSPVGRANKPGGSRVLGAGALGDAEQRGGSHDDEIGRGLYRRAGLNEEDAGVGGGKLGGKLAGINRRRKLLASGGIGGITGLIIAMAVVAPLYRIPAMLHDIEDKVSGEVDHIMERRAERIIVRYLIRRAGGEATDFVVTGSPLSDLFRTMQSKNAEEKIAKQTGLTFKKGADGVVRLFSDGRDLGGVRNFKEVAKLIERGTIENKADFRVLARTVSGPIKAGKIAETFKIRFREGKPFGAPKRPTNKGSDKANDEAALEELTGEQIIEGTANSIDKLGKAAGCMLDGGAPCDTFKQDAPDAKVPDPASDVAKRELQNGSAAETADEITQAADEAKNEAVKDRTGGFLNRMLEKLLTKIFNAVVARSVVKVIPWVFVIDTLADIQHAEATFFANDLIHRIPVMLKEGTYGAIFSTWAGYGSQNQAGRMPKVDASALNDQLGGAEGAQTYKYLYNKGQMNAGTTVNPKVGSNTFSKYDDLMNQVYNNVYVSIFVRGPLEIWYYTMGKALRLLGSGIGFLVEWLSNITGFTALAGSVLKSIFGDNWKAELGAFALKALLNLFAISIDPLAKGAELFNNIFTGASVAFNYVCKTDLGCQALTALQGVLITRQLQQEQDQDMAMTSIKDRIFDTSMPTSIAGSLLRAAPTNPTPSTMLSSLFGMAARLPSSIGGVFSPKIRADEANDMATLTGTLWYGATEDALNQDTTPAMATQKTADIKCPTTDPSKEANMCQADETVITSMGCAWDANCPDFQAQQ